MNASGDGDGDRATGNPQSWDEDDLRERLMGRREEIAERIRQLYDRGRELAKRPNRGSTPEELARAR